MNNRFPMKRAALLVEKPSGNYKCPHFVPPDVARELARAQGVHLDNDAAKALAEIAENFAIELVRGVGGETASARKLRKMVTRTDLVQ